MEEDVSNHDKEILNAINEQMETAFSSHVAVTLSGDTSRKNVYPEVVLQCSDHGYKLYGAFQSYSKQFIDEDNLTGESHRMGKIIDKVGGLILKRWNNEQYEVKKNADEKTKVTSSYSSGKDKLFSWSTEDRNATKVGKEREIESSKSNDNENLGDISVTKEKLIDSELLKKMHITFSKRSLVGWLNKIVEKESGEFMMLRLRDMERIQNAKMSREINERKQKDKEMTLKRQTKRNEEKEFASQRILHKNNRHGFLGGIFSMSQSNNNSGRNINSEDANSAYESHRKSKRFPFISPVSAFRNQTSPEKSKKASIREPSKEEQKLDFLGLCKDDIGAEISISAHDKEQTKTEDTDSKNISNTTEDDISLQDFQSSINSTQKQTKTNNDFNNGPNNAEVIIDLASKDLFDTRFQGNTERTTRNVYDEDLDKIFRENQEREALKPQSNEIQGDLLVL